MLSGSVASPLPTLSDLVGDHESVGPTHQLAVQHMRVLPPESVLGWLGTICSRMCEIFRIISVTYPSHIGYNSAENVYQYKSIVDMATKDVPHLAAFRRRLCRSVLLNLLTWNPSLASESVSAEGLHFSAFHCCLTHAGIKTF